jgi:hypothetical protein
LADVLPALTRLCLLHYEVDKKTALTKLSPPDARRHEILHTLGVIFPAM